jgi:hypothetical protein
MMRAARASFAAALVASLALVAPSAHAVPSYVRQYGVICSSCHTMWGSLTVAGATFRLSGYRAMNGKDLTPTEKPIELAGGALTMPGTFPASLITGVANEVRTEDRSAPAAARVASGFQAVDGSISRAGWNFTVADASIFLTAPLGKNLSFFIEFPMFETRAWEFTPTGPAEARDTTRGNLVLPTEKPIFEVAKFWWNNLLGDSAPRDSVNVLGGITHLPLAYPSGKVRLAVNQYLVYERRGLDYISPVRVNDLFTSPDVADRVFRLSEPQGMLEVNGMIVPGAPVTDVGKRQTFWMEYHLGGATASNSVSDGNVAKSVYGRFVARWYNQSLGVFAFWSPNIVDDTMIQAVVVPPAGPPLWSRSSFVNATVRAGPDATLSLAPFGVPLSLENCVLYNRESNPTGYGQEFVWWGGFHQLNYFPVKRAVAYARYDWIQGHQFDDRGGGGQTFAEPSEWDVIAGVQYTVLENFKLIGEYRYHEFKDASTSSSSTLKDSGFTLRAMTGF